MREIKKDELLFKKNEQLFFNIYLLRLYFQDSTLFIYNQ